MVDSEVTAWLDLALTISNIIISAILTIFLIYFAAVQSNSAKKSVNLSKLQRIETELRYVVEPLCSRINDLYYFTGGFPENIDNIHYQFYEYWNKILYHKYLCPAYLEEAISNYYNSKTSAAPFNAFLIGDKEENKIKKQKYEVAKKDLDEAVKRRKKELMMKQKEIIEKLPL